MPPPPCEQLAAERITAPAGPAGKIRKLPRKGPFRFEFYHRPSPETKAADIVRLWEKGVHGLQKTNCLLMIRFRDKGDAEAYSALYEINFKHFLNIINRRLTGFSRQISAGDVLQDAFLLIYRYPDKFRYDHDRSFYNWSYSILLNTIRRKIKKLGMKTVDLEYVSNSLPDAPNFEPISRAIAMEEIDDLKRLYSIYLMLYINVFRRVLSERDKKALHLIEVKQMSYRKASKKLGLTYGNFKMIVCRARKKIARGISDLVAATLTPELCN